MANEVQPAQGDVTTKTAEKPKPETRPKPAKAAEPTRWRLQNETRLSLGGGMITLKPGHVVDVQHYGVKGIQKILEAGAKLDPIS